MMQAIAQSLAEYAERLRADAGPEEEMRLVEKLDEIVQEVNNAPPGDPMRYGVGLQLAVRCCSLHVLLDALTVAQLGYAGHKALVTTSLRSILEVGLRAHPRAALQTIISTVADGANGLALAAQTLEDDVYDLSMFGPTMFVPVLRNVLVTVMREAVQKMAAGQNFSHLAYGLRLIARVYSHAERLAEAGRLFWQVVLRVSLSAVKLRDAAVALRVATERLVSDIEDLRKVLDFSTRFSQDCLARISTAMDSASGFLDNINGMHAELGSP